MCNTVILCRLRNATYFTLGLRKRWYRRRIFNRLLIACHRSKLNQRSDAFMFSPLLSLNLFPVPACELHLLERLTLITSGLFNCVIPLQDPILGLLHAALYYCYRNREMPMLLRCTQRWTQIRILRNFWTKYFFSFKLWFVWKKKSLITPMASFRLHAG
jgi:hypothetical protein